jgi:threonine aldolase
MSNLTSLLTFCGRGDEAIVGSESHIVHYEAGGASALGGIAYRTVLNDRRGMLDPDEVGSAIRGTRLHFPPTALVCLENTQNRCGGSALTTEDMRSIANVAHAHGVPVYVDGARIFNAAVALSTPVASLVADVDAIGFSLCKGLAAPVGSVLCGSTAFIARARKMRQMLGGGMRQAGIIAAAGIVALETMIDRLAEDHANAQILARGLAIIPSVVIDSASVETNIVIFEVNGVDAAEFQARLAEAGVLTTDSGAGRIRMLTHYGISRADVEEAVEHVRAVLQVRA